MNRDEEARGRVWVNIAASNNAWSGGVTPAHLAAIAAASPRVAVFDVPVGDLVGSVGQYELREDGKELWGLCELDLVPGGPWHGEALLTRHGNGSVELAMVMLTRMPPGALQTLIASRYPGRVGSL